MAQLLRSYGKAKLLSPLNLVNIPPNIFLPTSGAHFNAINRSRDFYKLQSKSSLHQVPYLFFPSGQIFLPTIKTNLAAIKNSQTITRRFKYEVRLFSASPINAAPNLFLPTVKNKLSAIETNQRERQIFKNSTKLRPPVVTNAIPNLFLPTLGSHLIAVKAVADSHKFRGTSKYSGINYSLLQKPPFLPTLGKYLNAVNRARDRNKLIQGSARIYQLPYLFFPKSALLPGLTVKLQAIQTNQTIVRRFKYRAYLRPPTVIGPKTSLSLPTLGYHLQAVESNRLIAQNISRKNSTVLRKPTVINPFVSYFQINYLLPPDTVWSQNAEFLQGSFGYNSGDLYNVGLPYNISPGVNMPTSYVPESAEWTKQSSPNSILWSGNPEFLQGSQLYNGALPYNDPIPYNAPGVNLVSVMAPNDTIWSGGSQ